MKFTEFFQTATGYYSDSSPYPWQERLANDPVCHSRLIDIPTGLGKTAGVSLAWLWNRVAQNKADWPRRLVYCLPMRTLVEQTEGEVRAWIDALVAANFISEDRKPYVVVLMGGESPEGRDKDWGIHPEEPAIIIGTQDMLLSRALNRGYGMTRYRWPMHFAILNNDALWIMDEVQLMGVGLESSIQLEAFRKNAFTERNTCTWWMSATTNIERFKTVDFRVHLDSLDRFGLTESDLRPDARAHQLTHSSKGLTPATITLSKASEKTYAAEITSLAIDKHQQGELTLIVVNRVNRAREIYQKLTSGKKPLYPKERVALIHSRFRPAERQKHEALLFSKNGGDRIIVATQAIEAGVDVSARVMITELAPWSSMVQRFGRSNRKAEFEASEIYWIDIAPDPKNNNFALPYEEADLSLARDALKQIQNACAATLREQNVTEKSVIRPVIRKRDLKDLFDTTPDICGQDLDISRYIRDNDDTDVSFYWRDIADAPDEYELVPQRCELCSVSIADAAKFLKKVKGRGWRWDSLERQWQLADDRAFPGATILLSTEAGGYHPDLGWTGDPKHKPVSSLLDTTHAIPQSAHDKDDETASGKWETIAQHTANVVEEMKSLANALNLDGDTTCYLTTAALWHDTGKAHKAFQEMLASLDPTEPDTLWAKSAKRGGKNPRTGFRHELASALAWLLNTSEDTPARDLVAYLIAAHHGKVRLSIRSLPNEKGDLNQPSRLFARGIWDGDKLPEMELADTTIPETTLDLSFMQMGNGPHGPSWLARTVKLRDELGPFQLAYLETLLRAADARAS